VRSLNNLSISLGGEHIGEDGALRVKTRKYISREFYENLRQGKTYPGDVLLVKDGATTGKVAFLREGVEQPLAVNEHVFVIRPLEPATLDGAFAFYVLYSRIGQEQIRRHFHGLIGGVKRENIQDVVIPLPPIPEQRAIAAALRTVQNARDARRRELEAERERKAALMEDLFARGLRGGPQKTTEIGTVPQGWSVGPLAEGVSQTQYGLSVRGEQVGQYPILRMNCLSDGKVSLSGLQYVDLSDKEFEAFRLRHGDLLFNRTNSADLVGKSGLFTADVECVFASYLVRVVVRPDKADPAFLNFYLNYAPTLTRLRGMAARGVSQANINASKLRTLLVPLPPLDEQRDIAEVLTACDAKIAALEAEVALHDELFRALLEELMSGRLSALPLVAEAAP